jgi:hypothetical protein
MKRMLPIAQGKARLYGTDFFHFIRLRVHGRDYYENGEIFYDEVDYFGVQIGPFSFLWTNPFAGES